eukprot:Awhi_evm1s642
MFPNNLFIAGLASLSYASPVRRASCGPGDMTMADVIKTNDESSPLITAVKLIDEAAMAMFSGDKDYTVFVPVNEAFEADGMDKIMKDKDLTAKMLRYYLVEGEISSDELKEGALTTVSGQDLDISIKGGRVFVNGAEIVAADIAACNGVAHVIDSVLMPPNMDMIEDVNIDMMDGDDDMMGGDDDMMDGDDGDDGMMDGDDDMMDGDDDKMDGDDDMMDGDDDMMDGDDDMMDGDDDMMDGDEMDGDDDMMDDDDDMMDDDDDMMDDDDDMMDDDDDMMDDDGDI